MKRITKNLGGQKWSSAELELLQKEPLTILDAFFREYGACIIEGCNVSPTGSLYNVSPGIVALQGKDAEGAETFKVVPFAGAEGVSLPIFLTITCEVIERPYADGLVKPIAYSYTAIASGIQPDVPFLAITAGGGRRFVDAVKITDKLDKIGNGKDVTVTFAESPSRGNVNSGERLSVLFGKVKRWFTDLRALAFKDKAGKADLDTALQAEIDGKVKLDGSNVMSGALYVNNSATGNGLKARFAKNAAGDSVVMSLNDTADAALCFLAVNVNNVVYYIGNTSYNVWHAGNLIIAPNNSVVASEIGNKIPKYTQSGYLNAVIFRDSWAKDDSLAINEIGFRVSQDDGYHRWCSFARLKTALGSMPANGGNADTVGGYNERCLMKRNPDKGIKPDAILGTSQYGFGYDSNGWPIGGSFISFGGFSDDYTTQIIAGYAGGGMYFRTFNGDDKVWNAWKKLAVTTDIPTSLPANGGNADASKMLSLRPDRPTVGNGMVVNQAADYSDAPIKGNWYTYLRMLHPTQGYFGELASPFSGNDPHPFYRMVVAGVTGQWNKIAFVKDIPDVSGFLPKSGGSLTGRLSTVNVAAMYGEGALRASIMYNGLTPITSGAYHSFLAMKSVEGNTLNFGGIGNNIGFYGFLHDRTENGFDYRFFCNTATGNWHLENGGIVLSGSTPEHVLKFRRNGSDKGYIGLGSSTSTDLIVQNAAGNSILKCADDGKCYANGKEIATVDQLTGDQGSVGGRDWNTIVTPGSYLTSAADWGTNGPPGTYLYGILVVSAAGTAITQNYCESNKGTMYYRVRYSESSGFGAWITVAKKSEVPATTASLPDSTNKRYVTDAEKTKITNSLEVICAGVVNAGGIILRQVGDFRASVVGTNRVAIDHDWGHSDDYIVMTMNSAGKTALVDINNNVTFTINFVSSADKVRFVMYKI